MPLLSHPDERIVYEVLAFLEAILEYGNTHVQEGLKDLIKSKGQQVFPTLKAILNRASIVYQERYTEIWNYFVRILLTVPLYSQYLMSQLQARTSSDQKLVRD